MLNSSSACHPLCLAEQVLRVLLTLRTWPPKHSCLHPTALCLFMPASHPMHSTPTQSLMPASHCLVPLHACILRRMLSAAVMMCFHDFCVPHLQDVYLLLSKAPLPLRLVSKHFIRAPGENRCDQSQFQCQARCSGICANYWGFARRCQLCCCFVVIDPCTPPPCFVQSTHLTSRMQRTAGCSTSLSATITS